VTKLAHFKLRNVLQKKVEKGEILNLNLTTLRNGGWA